MLNLFLSGVSLAAVETHFVSSLFTLTLFFFETSRPTSGKKELLVSTCQMCFLGCVCVEVHVLNNVIYIFEKLYTKPKVYKRKNGKTWLLEILGTFCMFFYGVVVFSLYVH